MKLKRRPRVAFAAWLGLFALGIQALIPLLVGVEIGLAADGGKRSIFALCAFGHVHPANTAAEHHHHDSDGHHHDHASSGNSSSQEHHDDDEDMGDLCPICVALNASPVFTSPDIVLLPVPAMRPAIISSTVERSAPHLLTLTAYRSRAPPLA